MARLGEGTGGKVNKRKNVTGKFISLHNENFVQGMLSI
jgi:hypothetical protein